MSLFALADTHLSFGTDKPMDVFHGWQDYEKRLEENWRKVVKEDDTVVIAGDISWAMKLEDSAADFAFLDSLPGRKIISKGNHDFWWNTKSKMDAFFKQNGFETLSVLYNNAYAAKSAAVCGTRGWFFDSSKTEDKKVLSREVGRLKTSIDEAKKTGLEPVVFLHYPPVYADGMQCDEIMAVLCDNGVRSCYYGHLHGASCRFAVNSEINGIHFSLISADFLKFCPKLIKKE